ncbi:cysteine--tRNA ligase [Pygmaiobacter massiliensis]|uniref:cysteine--tRNA ligase n=1 Tax=Pygmaiobacter massiliensis TaxID=1917873 RepID=UPI002A7EBAEC|nr:cysteine--tRNA ligase [Pygmaiobacter massiliensis]MDY4785655.1 cysteine--tRNA ligase [Pygmaiobacter massiliensis]
MKIFNTLTRQKDEFIPIKEGEYRIYVCGPTVYNFIHVGNARPVCVFDTLRRYLEFLGNKVYYVSNITDIDDKIIKKANEEGTTYDVIARRYEQEYFTDCRGLNVKPATVHPRATEHIDEILAITKDLVDKGFAYVANNGDVYFRAHKDHDYGKLSHQPLEDLEAGARISVGEIKEDPMDFAVWKSSKPGEPAWASPYGPGRPGWHIECSAMARRHLGDTIDLHCGGVDLVFPHHENEIAQSECANGCTFANYWMHNGFLNIDNHKMSKSLNNFFTVRDVAEQVGYEPIRFFLISGHYRSPLNYTKEVIESCKASLERLYTCRNNLDFAMENASGEGKELIAKAEAAKAKFIDAMDDDLNTADAIAAVFEFAREINTLSASESKESLQAAADMFDSLTGVLGLLYNRNTDDVPEHVKSLVAERTEVRKAKNWARADAIRDELASLGYVVEDTASGPKIVRK